MIDEIVNDLQRIADRKCYPEDVLDGSIAQEWVDYIVDLQQENKQLKSILTELEEWLKEEIYNFKQDGYDNSEIREDSLWLAGVYDEDKIILDKIQELKEKYK